MIDRFLARLYQRHSASELNTQVPADFDHVAFYTVNQKSTPPSFCRNFVIIYWHIFKLLSLTHSIGNLQWSNHLRFRHILNTSIHYVILFCVYCSHNKSAINIVMITSAVILSFLALPRAPLEPRGNNSNNNNNNKHTHIFFYADHKTG